MPRHNAGSEAGLGRHRLLPRLVLMCILSCGACPTSTVAQRPSAPAETGPVLLYAPESNLERSDLETLHRARVSVDIAMYSFTDKELAEELGRLARSGVRVRVYRDSGQLEQERQRGLSTTELLLATGVQVKVKTSRDLMHLKSYAIDGVLLRTGSANWSRTGLKRQDNDVRYDVNPELTGLFEARFDEMWERPSNFSPSAGVGDLHR
jgi:phosphatidylserine/phosphatidylglycerophosphate/cardiolipin synthase-like enzyme